MRKRVYQDNNKKEYNNKVFDVGYSIDGLNKAEYNILTQMALSRKALDIYERQLGCLLDENNQKLAMLIVDDYRKNEKCSLPRIYDEIDDPNIRNLITNLALVETLPSSYDEESLLGAIDKVKNEIKKQKLENLKTKISEISSLDPSAAADYLREYESLIRELGGKNG